MEEINLDFQSNNHREINLSSNLDSNISDVNIMKGGNGNDSASLGIELLMNKSKTGQDSPTPKIEEFKPSDPVLFDKPRSPSPSVNVIMDNSPTPPVITPFSNTNNEIKIRIN